MNINKIIDHIFKKLLNEGYSNEEVINFLSLRYKFSNAENFIYYLWLISSNKEEDFEYYQMAKIINQYLWTIIERHNIEPIKINSLVNKQIIYPSEFYLLDIKKYHNNLRYYLLEDFLIIWLHQLNYFFKNDDLYIELDKSFDNNWWISLLKTLNKTTNKFMVFQDNEINYIFLDYFNFKKIEFLYHNKKWNYFLVLSQETQPDYSLITYNDQDFTNWKTKWLDFLNTRKQNLDSNNIIVLLNNIFNNSLINQDNEILSTLLKENKTIIKPLSIYDLIPNETIINNFWLCLLTSDYDVIYSDDIISDYLNNIFIVYANNSDQVIENEDELIKLSMINDHDKLFDNELNQKIFNTTSYDTCIYLFKRIEENKFLFKGYYKVQKIFMQNNQPTFLLEPISLKQVIRNYIYHHQLITDNSYKNCFIKMINKDIYARWSDNFKESELVSYDIKNDEMNHMLSKYCWLFNKIVANYSNSSFIKYVNMFNEYYMRIINNINLIQNKNYISLLKNHLIDIDTFINNYLKEASDKNKQTLSEFLKQEKTKQEKIDFILNLINS